MLIMKDNDFFKIAVIGPGIIGGSMAYALQGFKNAKICGCDANPETRQKALAKKAVDEVFESPDSAICDADLVILCLYPELIPKIVSENSSCFKKGAVITDVCGVKTKLSHQMEEILPQDTTYVGGHPMADKETDGFDSATPELFRECGFIITPTSASTNESVQLIAQMAEHIGATRITYATPEEHDSIITYTSDLMHISASALCLDYNKKMNLAYTAGAFRDCTRIANINPQLWSQLFLENKAFLLKELDNFITSITRIRDAIKDENKETLERILTEVQKNKLTMQSAECRQSQHSSF